MSYLPDIHNELKYGNASGYSQLFTPYVVRDEDDAKTAPSILSNSQINFSSKYDLNHYWFIDDNQSRVNYFSGEVNRILSSLPSMSGSILSDILNSYLQNKVSRKIPFNQDKWVITSRSSILSKFHTISSIMGIPTPKVGFLSDGLFVVSPS